jgi:hypothetical protein
VLGQLRAGLNPPGPLGTVILGAPLVVCNAIITVICKKNVLFSKEGNTLMTFLTFEAANQTRRCNHNIHTPYGPIKSHLLDQTSKLTVDLKMY